VLEGRLPWPEASTSLAFLVLDLSRQLFFCDSPDEHPPVGIGWPPAAPAASRRRESAPSSRNLPRRVIQMQKYALMPTQY
jgi:hypothetical protein